MSYEPIDRNDAIAQIRDALRERSGKQWSVTGGRGTAWGWITIEAPPRRRVNGSMTTEDAAELAKLLDLDCVGGTVSIPASDDYRAEYIARAKGETPTTYGRPYWD